MATLFVGNVPFSASDEDLAAAFAQVGCTSAVMQRHEDSGRPKGWALVTVSFDAQSAILAMHDTEFEGRKLLVREDRGPTEKDPNAAPRNRRSKARGGGRGPREEPAEAAPCNTVFVGNLPWDVDSALLGSYFPGRTWRPASPAAPPPRPCFRRHTRLTLTRYCPCCCVTDLSAEVKTRRDGRSSGYALVTYESVELAQHAIACTNGMDIGGRDCLCRFDRG